MSNEHLTANDELSKLKYLNIAADEASEERLSPTRLRVGTSKTDDIYRQKRQTKHIMSKNEVFLNPKYFDNEDYDPQTYLNDILHDATEEEFVSLYNKLLRIHMGVRKNLEKNFYKNLNEYVFISSEVNNLSQDLDRFKSLLGVLEENIEGLNLVELSQNTSDDNLKRSMRRLENTIDGVNRNFWKSPNRSLITKQDRWTLINTRNQRVRLIVNLYLFNDCILVTSSHSLDKEKRIKEQTLYQWNLIDFTILPIETPEQADDDAISNLEKDSNLSYASVLCDRSIFVLGNSNLEERDFFIRQSRQYQSQQLLEHAQKRVGDTQLRMELEHFVRSEQASLSSYTSFQLLCKTIDSPLLLQSYALRREVLLNLFEQFNQLDNFISLRQYSDAIRILNLLRNRLQSERIQQLLTDFLLDKLEYKTERLKELFLHQIGFPGISVTQGKQLVRYLRSIGFENDARKQFFDSREEQLKQKYYNVQWEKDISNLVTTSSFIAFRYLAHITRLYTQMFEVKKPDSLYRNWLYRQIESLVFFIENQYKGFPRDKSYAETVSKVMMYSTELKNMKLEITPILQRLL
ncbi:exocyst complex subunit Exo84 [Schizosaccharomyces cryophilus OY26]|uniref:Exocyst complex subunit Exo84 n=1 Tax=Schizosaccharomyces cryophilus (strain OY26 / ATCC MYA-4695 / CBS 11777 / NBRC 106824 / NRRL Y48691) TaxID=653667 RepID=S9X1A4_SCHCR|nr:exocyst complex subunit Exo84 [Schizosaccharomyces cryophilus OY26]EPY50912.1 exocyst complex subunit Exo84 [Schizosaccharomyces cryophilus OY26]